MKHRLGYDFYPVLPETLAENVSPMVSYRSVDRGEGFHSQGCESRSLCLCTSLTYVSPVDKIQLFGKLSVGRGIDIPELV